MNENWHHVEAARMRSRNLTWWLIDETVKVTRIINVDTEKDSEKGKKAELFLLISFINHYTKWSTCNELLLATVPVGWRLLQSIFSYWSNYVFCNGGGFSFVFSFHVCFVLIFGGENHFWTEVLRNWVEMYFY